jgi:peptidoglycan/xylan/chitin deacetylase (PgdA/CDA1 family)
MATPESQAMRIDRWLTLSIVTPLSRVLPPQPGIAIPVLMYHSIAHDVDDTVRPYFRTVTTPARFAEQMSWLRMQGYQTVSLSGLARAFQETLPPAGGQARKVVITFDDGFRDFYRHAYPVLADAGFDATVFVPSAYIDKPFLTGRDCLRSHELRELSDRGIEFGSHSVSHRQLVELCGDELIKEVADSRNAIQDITGKEVTLFSYPYRFPAENASFKSLLGGLLDDSGYRTGVTTTIGRARPTNDQRFLPRLPVNDCDDAPLFAAKLRGHYDWLQGGQLMRKKVRAGLRGWTS